MSLWRGRRGRGDEAGGVDDYRPVNRRRRVLIAVLGIVTTVVVVLMLTERPGGARIDPRLLQGDSARCQPGQTTGCVGGKVQVFTVPSTAASSGR